MLLNDMWIKFSSASNFLTGQSRYLDFLRRNNSNLLAKGKNLFENVLIVIKKQPKRNFFLIFYLYASSSENLNIKQIPF